MLILEQNLKGSDMFLLFFSGMQILVILFYVPKVLHLNKWYHHTKSKIWKE